MADKNASFAQFQLNLNKISLFSIKLLSLVSTIIIMKIEKLKLFTFEIVKKSQ